MKSNRTHIEVIYTNLLPFSPALKNSNRISKSEVKNEPKLD